VPVNSFFSQHLIPLLETYGLLTIFISMTLESACIPIPSEIVVPYGGWLASQGYVQFWQVVVVATAANLVGSSIAYWIGRTGGRALFLRYGRYVFIRPEHLDSAERWFARRGEITVFFTRMMPVVRTFISVPAGIARMKFGKFLVYSALGAVLWNLGLAYLGYLFGANWDQLQKYFERYNTIFYILLVMAVVAIAVFWWVRRDRRLKRLLKPPQTPEE
jgi:membrane protein DedA with SNARE-associated domain